jgi:hypothetical protein
LGHCFVLSFWSAVLLMVEAYGILVTMTTHSDLQVLADQLTELTPPPTQPLGLNNAKPGTGKWKVVPIGAGGYALRIEYENLDGGLVIGRADPEISGFASNIRQSLSFMLSVTRASRFYWHPA